MTEAMKPANTLRALTRSYPGLTILTRRLRAILLEAVAQPAHGDDAHAARLELLAQAMDVYLDGVGRHLLAPFAQVRHQLVLRHQPPGALHEDLEHAHLARRQLDRRPVQARHAADLVVG